MDIQASATCVTVLVADDHEVVRRGIESLLTGTNTQVVAEASCGDDAIRLTKTLRPDVVLLDIRMPEFDGLMILDTLRREVPDTKVVMLSTSDNPTYGLNNKEISRSLGISTETVKEHVQHILRKIAVNDRTQAAVWAVRKGMVG